MKQFFKNLFLGPREEEILTVSVEEIHNDIDAAEQKSVDNLNNMLVNLGVIPTEHIHSKAEKMLKLGFKTNEAIDASKKLKQTEENNQKLYDKLKLFQEYKKEYPLEKIITIEQFEEILNKYRLVYAPSKYYIKDIPEKVIDTLSKCKKLKLNHYALNVYKASYISFYNNHNKKYVKLITNFLSNTFHSDKYLEDAIEKYLVEINSKFVSTIERGLPSCYKQIKYIEIDRKELQIAAPASHFDEDYFKKINQKTKIVITKDPIAFNFLKDGFVRILDKWGTDDDQSYLDPALTNEINN